MLLISAGACYGWYLVLGQWTLADVDSRAAALYYVDDGRCGCRGSSGKRRAVGSDLERRLAGDPRTRAVPHYSRTVDGGAQASLLGLAELFVTLLIAFVALGERLSPVQWVGGVLLMISVVLASRESHLEVSWEDLLRDGRWRELQ